MATNTAEEPGPPAPNPLRWNAASNLIGRLVQAGLALISVPILLHYLGTSQYGLVGLAVALDALQFFDLGLSGAVYRQVARNVATGHHAQNAELLRAAEAPYIGIGVALAGALAIAAPVLARDWFHAGPVTQGAVTRAIEALALSFCMKWPLSLFTATLRGLQKHVLVNALTVAGAVVRTVLGILVVVFVRHSAAALFLTQAAVTLVLLGIVVRSVRLRLGRARPPHRRRRDVLRGIWRYAIALNGISMGIAFLTQLPAILVGRELGLHSLGLYSIAYTLAAVVSYAPNAIADAAFPRLSAELTRADVSAVRITYLRSTRLAIAGAAMSAFPIAFLGQRLLFLWTHSPTVSSGAAEVIGLLALGNLMFATWNLPYTLMLAEGRTKFLLIVIGTSIVLLVTGLVLGLGHVGIEWAGFTWLVVNSIVAAAVVIAAHGGNEFTSAIKYVLADILPFIAGGAAVFGAAAWLVGENASAAGVAIGLACGAIAYLAICYALVPPRDREWIAGRIKRRHGLRPF